MSGAEVLLGGALGGLLFTASQLISGLQRNDRIALTAWRVVGALLVVVGTSLIAGFMTFSLLGAANDVPLIAVVMMGVGSAALFQNVIRLAAAGVEVPEPGTTSPLERPSPNETKQKAGRSIAAVAGAFGGWWTADRMGVLIAAGGLLVSVLTLLSQT